MSVTFIQQIFNSIQNDAPILNVISIQGWISEQVSRAAKTKLFREYLEGDHRANLTEQMRKNLRIPEGEMNEFNDNYMDVIVQTMNDLLEVTTMEGDNPKATAWAQQILESNGFDAMQSDVHEAAIGDADTFLMIGWDNETGEITWTHEPAFDGVEGMLVVYGENTIEIAVKVWNVTAEDKAIADNVRINVYLPDQVRKYISRNGGALMPYQVDGEEWPAPWLMKDGTPIGVPVVHFKNRSKKHSPWGLSEIENAIPLQDALNRTIYSMVMAGENTAFQIRVAKGFEPPANVTPGMWVVINRYDEKNNALGLDKEDQVDAFTLETGEIVPFIEQAKFFISQIGAVTRTPAPEIVWDNASGEALLQRQKGLLGKLRRFKLKAGATWEKCLKVSHRVQEAFGEQPPPFKRFATRWKPSEPRDDSTIVKNAMAVRDELDEQTFLETIAPAFGWDQKKIEAIIERKQKERQAGLAALGAGLPRFGNTNNR